ncbi:hypothetical protein Glove_169g64 [Diversispora epigaea]|uniref:BED-type domain-containing protein n=1 Tax=Diversispora epigaea TaxID=1348612 RepID=A0A397IZ15_9GLOM|nr:hypothetical protein Glove_169g64 [Diversispora epigaea]
MSKDYYPVIDGIHFDPSARIVHKQDQIESSDSYVNGQSFNQSLIEEQDTATTSSIIYEQVQIESSDSCTKSEVWKYFIKSYGLPQSRKTKCSICNMEFSYHGSTTSLKYHLKNKHNIYTNLSQVKRQLQQIPSQQSIFSPYSEPSFSENENSLLQFIHNIDMSTNSSYAMDQIHENENQPLNLQLQKNADILNSEEMFFTVLNNLLEINRNDEGIKDALIMRAKFYRKMGMYGESIADLNKVLEIEPNNVKALTSMKNLHIDGSKIGGDTYQSEMANVNQFYN